MEEKIAEIVLQYLYSAGFGDVLLEDLVPVMMRTLSISKKSALLGKEKAAQILEKVTDLDEKITETVTDYAPDRLSEVDRNVLRLALYSIIFEKADVEKVIHDAIRLSKKFSSPDSGAFVHAIISEASEKLICKIG